MSLSGCLGSLTPPPVGTVEVLEEEVKPPKPIVPPVDRLRLRDVEWVILTPDNYEEIFNNLDGSKSLFAITGEGYENLALNLSDTRALIQQQKEIIAIYEKQFE